MTKFAYTSPSSSISLVTPDDVADLPRVAKSLHVGTGGDIRVVTVDNDDVVIPGVASGSILPVQVKKVFATSTTASGIVALH